MCALCTAFGAMAQTDDSTYTIWLGGAELRTDSRVPFEFHLKRLSDEETSFAFKLSRFNYAEKVEDAKVFEDFHGKDVSYGYLVKGFTVKSGLLFNERVSEKRIMYHGVYGVLSGARHTLNRTWQDEAGEQERATEELMDIVIGFEYEFFYGIRLNKKTMLSLAVQAGTKEFNVPMFKDVVDGLPAYKRYTPAQGYSSKWYYANATLGLSIAF